MMTPEQVAKIVATGIAHRKRLYLMDAEQHIYQESHGDCSGNTM